MFFNLFNKFFLFSISLHLVGLSIYAVFTPNNVGESSEPILINYIENRYQGELDSKKIVAKADSPAPEPILRENSLEVNNDKTPNFTDIEGNVKVAKTVQKRFTDRAVDSSPANSSVKAEEEIEIAYPDYKINPKPKYPLLAQRRGYEGEVVLRAYVLGNGSVGELKIDKSSGYKILDKSAADTIKKWVFVPGKQNGSVIATWINIPVIFRLDTI